MDSDIPAELMQQLLDACNEGSEGATHLAERTDTEAMRTFLHESARQYRRAVDEIRTVWNDDGGRAASADRRRGVHLDASDEGDIAACWERAECEALTYFRDAYDTALPPRVADTIKRHYEAGIDRLERLRKLQARAR